MADLQPYVTAAYRRAMGYSADPAFRNFVAVFRDYPHLLAEAKAELARLDQRGGRRVLAEHDHQSKAHADTLRQMLKEYEDTP